jgi:hypothetical protein
MYKIGDIVKCTSGYFPNHKWPSDGDRGIIIGFIRNGYMINWENCTVVREEGWSSNCFELSNPISNRDALRFMRR